MPKLGNSIHIRYGTKSQYDNLQKIDENSIYFLSDTDQIYVGSEEFSKAVHELNDAPDESIIGLTGRLYVYDSSLYAYINDTWVNLSTFSTGTGLVFKDGVVSLEPTDVTPGIYGPIDDESLRYVNIPNIEVDEFGRIINIENKKIEVSLEWEEL